MQRNNNPGNNKRVNGRKSGVNRARLSAPDEIIHRGENNKRCHSCDGLFTNSSALIYLPVEKLPQEHQAFLLLPASANTTPATIAIPPA